MEIQSVPMCDSLFLFNLNKDMCNQIKIYQSSPMFTGVRSSGFMIHGLVYLITLGSILASAGQSLDSLKKVESSAISFKATPIFGTTLSLLKPSWGTMGSGRKWSPSSTILRSKSFTRRFWISYVTSLRRRCRV